MWADLGLELAFTSRLCGFLIMLIVRKHEEEVISYPVSLVSALQKLFQGCAGCSICWCASLLMVMVFLDEGGGEVWVTVGSVRMFFQLQPADSGPHSIPF